MAGSGVSLFPGFDLASVAGFAEWTQRLVLQGDPRTALGGRLVPTTYWWITEGDRYLGAIDLRHELNDFLALAGGHIGYGVRPSARRRGLGSWALGEVLARARSIGLDRVLITCDVDNLPSARTIERNGGELESVTDTPVGRKRRYWVAL